MLLEILRNMAEPTGAWHKTSLDWTPGWLASNAKCTDVYTYMRLLGGIEQRPTLVLLRCKLHALDVHVLIAFNADRLLHCGGAVSATGIRASQVPVRWLHVWTVVCRVLISAGEAVNSVTAWGGQRDCIVTAQAACPAGAPPLQLQHLATAAPAALAIWSPGDRSQFSMHPSLTNSRFANISFIRKMGPSGGEPLQVH